MAEQDRLIQAGQAELSALRQRFEALQVELRARDALPSSEPQDLARADALLRSAIIAVGDDALRLLRPASEEQSLPAEVEDVVRVSERQP